MSDGRRTARRYHWLSEGLESFVDSPHSAIEGRSGGEIVNLADRRAAGSRQAQLALLKSLGPDGLVREAAALRPSVATDQPPLPHLLMPSRHDVTSGDVVLRRLHASLAAADEAGPADFPELLQVPGVGARTIRSLAMVAEIVHGEPCRFSDPARYSLAHGGKDRHPFPVPLKVYDKTINVLKSAVEQAKLGRDEKIGAIRRLDQQARRLEAHVGGPSLDAFIAEERAHSGEYGGMSIFGPEPTAQAGTDSIASRTA